MIYVPSNEIKKTVVGQKTLYIKDAMNKSNLDRSSRSVIDAYKSKFDLVEIDLEAYRKYLNSLLGLATDLSELLSEQLDTYKEQVGPDVPATEKGREELEEIEKVIEQAEEDLDEIKDGIDDRIECMFACYAGGQDKPTCLANCEMNCQGGCLTNCQASCETQCQDTCESTSQDTCQAVTEQTCTSICESYCQSICQTNVQYSCSANCEKNCQSTCEVSTQS